MKEKFYLFVFVDGSSYEIPRAISLKDAILKMVKYTGEEDNDLFYKSLCGFDSNDINGLINLFNNFSYKSIINAYLVKEKVYPKKK